MPGNISNHHENSVNSIMETIW